MFRKVAERKLRIVKLLKPYIYDVVNGNDDDEGNSSDSDGDSEFNGEVNHTDGKSVCPYFK